MKYFFSRHRWLLLTLMAPALIFFGCKGDTGPAGPAGTNPPLPPVITAVVAIPDSIGTGEYTTLFVSAYDPNGDDISYHWTATVGTLNAPDAAETRWMPPDSIALYTINVTATDVNGTTSGSVMVGVNMYVPAVTPSYLGNNDQTCGHCHQAKHFDWMTTPHSSAFANEFIGNEHKTTGYNLAIDNGGYDDHPGPWLENVQCEACHGPQGPDVGDHRNLSLGAMTGESCGQCHAEWPEYQYSGHGTAIERAGGHEAFLEEWQGAGCRGCHISEGFLAVHDPDWTDRPLPEQAWQVSCGTCHDPHSSSDDNPEQLRVVGAFELLYGGEDNPGHYAISDWGKGQTCGQCHHSRRDRTAIMGYIANGNQRANPHESPQADMVAGRGSYEIPGMTYNRTNQHDLSVPPLDNVCVSCHMRTLDTPYEHANHNFYPEVVSCYGCHGTPTNFDINNKQTEIVNLLDDLALLLPNPVLGDDGHYTVSSDTRDTLTWTLPKRESGWAWQFVHLDGSRGVHNYNYAHDLLTNAIDHLTSGPMSKPESYENTTSMR